MSAISNEISRASLTILLVSYIMLAPAKAIECYPDQAKLQGVLPYANIYD